MVLLPRQTSLRKHLVFNMPDKPTEGGELILFWENGLAPVKTQADLFFSLVRHSDGGLFFVNGAGLEIPFNYSGDRNGVNLKSVESLHVAFPKYVAQTPYYSNGSVIVNDQQITLAKAEDINELAFKTLQQRSLKELGKILSRLAVKKWPSMACVPRPQATVKQMVF
jgi:hypothetical protein